MSIHLNAHARPGSLQHEPSVPPNLPHADGMIKLVTDACGCDGARPHVMVEGVLLGL